VSEPSAKEVIWSSPWGSLGDLATASFVISALSGAAVAVPFNPADGYGSIATMLLANPAGIFFRNLHYWTSQACLILTVLHIWDHLRSSTEQRVRRGVWLRLSLTLPLLVFIMLSGFMLRGDADARQALRIVTEAISRIPLVGSALTTFAFGVGGRLDVVYVQHAATATILVWLFIIEHARRVWPKLNAFLSVLLTTGNFLHNHSPDGAIQRDVVSAGPGQSHDLLRRGVRSKQQRALSIQDLEDASVLALL
jgi:ubiquinol-cytochrome c reductase cytochrome b subunit